MDDKEFDDIIKNKIGEYQYPGVDEDAFSQFQSNLSLLKPNPWYVRYRNELLTAAASILLGVLIVGLQYQVNQDAMEKLTAEMSQLKDQNNTLLEGMNNQAIRRDTVRIIEYRESTDGIQDLREQVLSLQRIIENTPKNTPVAAEPEINPDQQLVFAGTRATLSPEAIDYLSKEHRLVENGEFIFLLVDTNMTENETPAYLARKNVITSHYTMPQFILVADSLTEKENTRHIVVAHNEVKLPVKTLRKLEKNRYEKGVGIEIGPAADVYRTFYHPGRGESAFGGGVLANFITSPRLSIETGALFNTSEYKLSEKDTEGLDLPSEDPVYGDFKGIDVTSWFLEFPVNLKYRHRISASNHLVGGVGISGYLYTKQEFEYLYDYDVDGNLVLPVESHFRVNSPEFYLGTANLSLGLSSTLKNGKRLEASVFYKRSISPMGYDQLDTQFIGLRTAYMFTVR